MLANVILPRTRRRAAMPPDPFGWQRGLLLLRGFAAVLVLVPIAVFTLVSAFFVAIFSGFVIGGASPALEAKINLVGAGIVGLAWFVSVLDVGAWRMRRLALCIALTVVCIAGGLASERLLRHSPAVLDPHGGHKVGEFRKGYVFWEAAAIGTAACALAVVIAPGRMRLRR